MAVPSASGEPTAVMAWNASQIRATAWESPAASAALADRPAWSGPRSAVPAVVSAAGGRPVLRHIAEPPTVDQAGRRVQDSDQHVPAHVVVQGGQWGLDAAVPGRDGCGAVADRLPRVVQHDDLRHVG